jgi:predicted enzyme related to lactoylglutathione lyase
MQFLVNIDVDDLERAARFYSGAFGLRPGRRFGGDGLELLGGSAPIYLLPKAAGTPVSPASSQERDYRRHWTPVHLDIVVDDIGAALQRALDAGATLEQPVSASRWGKLALLADPFGHGLCLIEFVGRGYDEVASADTGLP